MIYVQAQVYIYLFLTTNHTEYKNMTQEIKYKWYIYNNPEIIFD